WQATNDGMRSTVFLAKHETKYTRPDTTQT
ncbi:hypothetical protein J2S06_003155, partial [Bacillus alveayuensis]|nr:hypothetical protein [Bacillus alveayuensis]